MVGLTLGVRTAGVRISLVPIGYFKAIFMKWAYNEKSRLGDFGKNLATNKWYPVSKESIFLKLTKLISEIIKGIIGGVGFSVISFIGLIILFGLVFTLDSSSSKPLVDWLSVLNIFIIFPITFAIGLFTYYSAIYFETRGTLYSKNILTLGEMAFVGDLFLVLSFVFIHAKKLQLTNPPIWLTQIVDIIYSAGGFLLILSLSFIIVSLFMTLLFISLKIVNEFLSFIYDKLSKE